MNDQELDEMAARLKTGKLDALFERLEQADILREGWLKQAEEIATRLSSEGETDIAAEFLGRLCNSQDVRFGLGSQLCLEWMLDHYVAKEFDRAYPWILDIWKYLIENGHNFRSFVRGELVSPIEDPITDGHRSAGSE